MKIEDIYVGLAAEITHQLTTEDVTRFVELTGDNNRIHIDTEFASHTAFKKPVAHGMLGASFISTLIGTKLPGDGALWFSQTLDFLLPARVGDKLTVRGEVTTKDATNRVIGLNIQITNQFHQTITQGTAKVKLVPILTEATKETVLPVIRKTALVIGGSGGIGSAVCGALANAGFDVAVHYCKNEISAQAVVSKLTSLGHKAICCNADITEAVQVTTMMEHIARNLGAVTVLVNCATPIIFAQEFRKVAWRDIKLHLDNQIKGVFHLVRAVLPDMEKQHQGKIINIVSHALESPPANFLPYITAKGALLGFSRALAIDLAPKGIQVNMVSPGMTDTDLIASIPERAQLVTAARTPMRRLATPQDVANAIVFLASAQSNYLCGETIRVNGGQVMI